MENFDDIKDYLNICVKCGKCLARCPVYHVTRDEKNTARGKISLLQNLIKGEIIPSEILYNAAEECLYCLNCQDACPYHINMDEIIPVLRQKAANWSTFTHNTKKIIDHTLGRPKAIKVLPVAGKQFLTLLANKVPPERGMHLRFPLPNVPKNRLLPKLTEKPLLDKLPEFIQGDTNKPTVAVFLGCLHNFLDIPTGKSIIDLLKLLNFSIWIPKKQSCCGLPFLSMGMNEAFKRLAKQNLTAFSAKTPDYIVSGCPSCVTNLKDHYGKISFEGEKFAKKVKDITSLLYTEIDSLNTMLKKKNTNKDHNVYVTYHDSCHLSAGLGVKDEPRLLLKELYGKHFAEMNGADRCCGGGGSFSITHYSLSKKIAAEKRQNIQHWQNQITNTTNEDEIKFKVITACPGCELQINDTLHQSNPEIEVVDIIDELIRRLK